MPIVCAAFSYLQVDLQLSESGGFSNEPYLFVPSFVSGHVQNYAINHVVSNSNNVIFYLIAVIVVFSLA